MSTEANSEFPVWSGNILKLAVQDVKLAEKNYRHATINWIWRLTEPCLAYTILDSIRDVSVNYFIWNISVCFVFFKYFSPHKKQNKTVFAISQN